MSTLILDYCIHFNNVIQDEESLKVEIYSFDGYSFYHKITYDDNECMKTFNTDNKVQISILLEIFNKSELWSMKIEYNEKYSVIRCNIFINESLINDFTNKSNGLYLLILSKISRISVCNTINTDVKNISFIPKSEPVNPPNDFKVRLHNYQKKNLARMLEIENKDFKFKIDNTHYIKIGSSKIYFDPIYCKLNEKSTSTIYAKSKGGVLADEMGLGKTITCISLIVSNPYVSIPNTYLKTINYNQKIISKATVVVCPSHLLSQWNDEVKKCCPHFKTIVLSTKNDYKGLTFDNFINADIIITSYQFLMNFSFYPSLYYRYCTSTNYNFDEKNIMTQTSLKSILEVDNTLDKLKEHTIPIFEFFSFHRLVLDETHEIFGNMLSNASQSKYLSNWVTTIDADYNWYVSGTPFVNYDGMINCCRYIKLELDNDKEIKYNFNLNQREDENIKIYKKIINTNSFWDTVFKKLCIRHRKSDVEDEINIMGYQEKLVWVKFTDTEKQLYNAKKSTVCETELQQLCCHPLILESAKKIVGNLEEVDLDVIKSKLIEHHKHNLESYSKKLGLLDKTKPEYGMVSSNYNRIISESRFILNILEKIDEPATTEESCAICMDFLDNPTMTSCGHMFCYDCIKMCLNNVKKCPMCKQDLEGKELIKIISQQKEEVKKDITQENILIEKYGSKLGKLISIIRCLTTRDDTRIIIFSQWDDMLRLIGKTLVDNGIGNSFVKGNVWSRTSAIKKFKNGDENKVIMLSLKNAASGTNLTEATHIFFVEPINGSRKESLAIEGQAIARACRIGQKQQVMILRVLVEDTIEQDIYSKYYDPNVVVANEEKDYFVNMAPQVEDNTDTSETKEKKKVIRKKKTDNNDSVNVNNDLTTEKKKRVVRNIRKNVQSISD